MSFLVPVDLSAPSVAAIEMAVMLGRALGEDAILLHVSEFPPPLIRLSALYEVSSPLRQAGLVARLRTVQGGPAEQIIKEAGRRNCRWVVMGTRGALGGPDSVAAAVMANSPVPVLAVRPGTGDHEFASIVLCSRPRSQAPWAWDVANLLAGSMGTKLIRSSDRTGCTANGDACSEDALIVLDVASASDPVVTATLLRERCTVLLVSRPS